MRKFEIKDAAITEMAVQQEIQRSEESRYDHRLHAVLMICKGFSCYEVADFFGHSPRTIQYWVKRFEEKGFEGLVDNPRSGRPRRFNGEIMEAIKIDLRQSPLSFQYPQNTWDGKLLSRHLAEKFSVQFGVRQCQRLLNNVVKQRPITVEFDPITKVDHKEIPEITEVKSRKITLHPPMLLFQPSLFSSIFVADAMISYEGDRYKH
ncbi:MAG: helix-turn-helix domain-containing protein [Syntrophales bacterium]